MLLLSAQATLAQHMPVPSPMQASLFAKILTFDRNLKARAGNDIRIGVLYQKKVRASLEAYEEFLQAMCGDRSQRIERLALNCVGIEWTNAADLDNAVARRGIRFLYVAPLRTVAVEEIVEISRARKITTLTGVPEYVEKGIALGLTLRAERPLILVDLGGSRAEGANFNSQLLKLAKVVGPQPGVATPGAGGGTEQ
ncbi:MAG TPA: YfiR/HmsC family protein [Thermoanaerobaculia bacterium]|nr:YfiR/HmsC family protein [Thermoanaerobaculia bacterium]